MSKYKCTICGYVYDEAEGYEAGGIAPGTKWEDLPEDFCAPLAKSCLKRKTNQLFPK